MKRWRCRSVCWRRDIWDLAETIHAVESARAKLEQVMPLELKRRVQALTETITLDLNATPLAMPGQVMLTMSSATQLQQRVHLRYRSSQADETERDFDPYGLVCRQGKWYAVGRCHLRRSLRSFRLDRIVQVDLTETHFDRPTDFDALEHVVQAIATLPRRFSFTVLLKTDLSTAQSEIFEVLGLLEPEAAGVLLRGSTDNLDWLARQLARLPFDFLVREPEQLRAALRQRADE